MTFLGSYAVTKLVVGPPQPRRLRRDDEGEPPGGIVVGWVASMAVGPPWQWGMQCTLLGTRALAFREPRKSQRSFGQRRRPSCRDAVVTNVTNSLRLKIGPVLATEGELRQTASRTASRQCVEANGAGAVASSDGKQTNNGVS